MSWPFEDTFTTAPAAGWLDNRINLTFSHNAGVGAIDISNTALNRGMLRINEMAVPRLTFVADIEMLTIANATSNGVGIWAVTSPTRPAGYNFMNWKGAVAYNAWACDRVDSSGVGNIPTSNFVSQGNAIDGKPVFALNKIMRHQLEISSVQVGGRWIDSFVYTVDGQLVMQFADWYSNAMNLGTYTPGIFLWGGTARVHYVSGHTNPNAADWVANGYATPDIRHRSPVDGLSGESLLPVCVPTNDVVSGFYVEKPMRSMTGRILDESFMPRQCSLYLRRADGEYVAYAESDEDGNYKFSSFESGYTYLTEFIDSDGIIKDCIVADYVGFGELAGRYTIRGENSAGCEVRVFSEVTGEYLGKTTTDSNGQFVVPNVNPSHLFTLVFREATGAWEDRVSSRRIPELQSFSLKFASTLADDGDRITGSLKVTNGRGPFTASSPELREGMGFTVVGNQIFVEGSAVIQGPYSIPINVTSADGGTGTYFHEGIGGDVRSNLQVGETMSSVLETDLDRLDPNFSMVKALLHFDPRTVSVSEGVAIDTSSYHQNWTISPGVVLDTTDFKFGGGSMKFAATGLNGVYLPDDNGFVTGDFTAEFWFKADTSKTTHQTLLSFNHINGWYTALYLQGANKAVGMYSNGYSQIFTGVAGNAVANNTWTHMALCRQGTTTTLYQNGVSVATSSTAWISSRAVRMLLGSRPNDNSEGLFGNIDDFRYTPGLCRYTANFTPPTRAYVDNSDQSIG